MVNVGSTGFPEEVGDDSLRDTIEASPFGCVMVALGLDLISNDDDGRDTHRNRR